MADFDDAMVAGFQSAVKDRPSDTPAGKEMPKSARDTRHRDARAQPRDPGSVQLIEGKELRAIVDRIVRLTEEKGEVQDSIKAEYAAAKEKGYDNKALRIVVKRAMEDESARAARTEVEETAEVMMRALGMLAGTPLGDAAMGATH